MRSRGFFLLVVVLAPLARKAITTKRDDEHDCGIKTPN
jgi:hypothetical protein